MKGFFFFFPLILFWLLIKIQAHLLIEFFCLILLFGCAIGLFWVHISKSIILLGKKKEEMVFDDC